MRLCWLVSDDYGGGVFTVAISCVRQAAVAGHHATLLLAHEPRVGLVSEDEGGAGIATLSVDNRVGDTPALLLDWLKAHPQDVVVFNACDQAEPAIPYLPASIHCIYAVHDEAPRYWKQAVHYERDLDAVTVVSNAVAGRIRARMKDPEKLHVIYPGSYFPPEPESVLGRSDDLIFCGGDNPSKGALDLVALWKLWNREGASYTLHWFGSMEPAFEARVRALPGADRIHLYGHRPRADIYDVAARCRVSLMLSRAEAFGTVNIEAMSMGCVSVAWDLPLGAQEAVEMCETGLFVRLGDYAALSRAVARAVRAQPEIGALVVRCVREAFSEQAQWIRYRECLALVMHRPPSVRTGVGGVPRYEPPRRYYQLLPASTRARLRSFLGRHPWLGYAVRNYKGL